MKGSKGTGNGDKGSKGESGTCDASMCRVSDGASSGDHMTNEIAKGTPSGGRGGRGERGDQGARGESGERGERGERGQRGNEGPQGVQGLIGYKVNIYIYSMHIFNID